MVFTDTKQIEQYLFDSIPKSSNKTFTGDKGLKRVKDILQKLEEKHPGQFTMRNKRTLHRRLKPWKLERIFARSKVESSDGNLLKMTPISIYGTPTIGQVTTMAG